MLDSWLLSILVCPATKLPLSLAPSELLAAVNTRISAGELRNVKNEPVQQPLMAALVRQDGKILYPILDEIPLLLVDEGIPL